MGAYYRGLWVGNRGICWSYIGGMEKNMEPIHCNRVYTGLIAGNKGAHYIGLIRVIFLYSILRTRKLKDS